MLASLIGLAALGVVGVPAATVLEVGGTGAHTTIQDAIDAAPSGATIRVAAGICNENVVVDRGVSLEGGWNSDFSARDWDTHLSLIHGLRSGSVITPTTSDAVTIEGFTITGGLASFGGANPWGGGIRIHMACDPGPIVIRHNVITDNIAQIGLGPNFAHGGGISICEARAVIEENTITGNIAQSGAGQWGEGGGISVTGMNTQATIVGNVITGNMAVDATGDRKGEGGGVHISYVGPVVFRDNEVSGNTAAVNSEGWGGGIYVDDAPLMDNRVLNNTASVNGVGLGGGIYADYAAVIRGCIVEGNVASETWDGSGGGVYESQLSRFIGNTVRDNRATRGGGLYLRGATYANLLANRIEGNQATGNNPGTNDGGGGIAADGNPQIVGNQIIDNSAGLAGGGLLITGGSQWRIRDNLIEGNSAFTGGGLSLYRESASSYPQEAVNHNRIVGNTATWGGGMYLLGGANPPLDANTVTGNTAVGLSGTAGGGVLLNTSAGVVARLTNHIIASNTGGVGDLTGGVHCISGACELINCSVVDNGAEGIRIGATSAMNHIRNCIIAGHTTGVFINAGVPVTIDHNDWWENTLDISGATWGPNHMEADPAFVDRMGGDLHLGASSPLEGQGDVAVNVARDLDGDLRPGGSGVDIGADEIYRTQTYVSTAEGSDLTGTGASEEPFATVGRGLAETGASGEVFVAQGTYEENLEIDRSVNLLGGYDESDWSLDISTHETTLDGGGVATTVRVSGE
ncbi:right-handed parallel beta-helix repeat-containing protein [Candidatus Sumerlaeota bacterium]|nr:right-handed parallel beta-helix repeat-containing protein [Candidatus Sumerlaeota bacterium]